MKLHEIYKKYIELYEVTKLNTEEKIIKFLKVFQENGNLIHENYELIKNDLSNNNFAFFEETLTDILHMNDIYRRIIQKIVNQEDLDFIKHFRIKHEINLNKLKAIFAASEYQDKLIKLQDNIQLFDAIFGDGTFDRFTLYSNIVENEKEYFCHLYINTLFGPNGDMYYQVNELINYIFSQNVEFYNIEEDNSDVKKKFLSQANLSNRFNNFSKWENYIKIKYQIDNLSEFYNLKASELISYTANIHINNILRKGDKRKLPIRKSFWDSFLEELEK